MRKVVRGYPTQGFPMHKLVRIPGKGTVVTYPEGRVRFSKPCNKGFFRWILTLATQRNWRVRNYRKTRGNARRRGLNHIMVIT